MKLNKRDVEYIVADLWNNRKSITSKVLPHLRLHFPSETRRDVEQQIMNFLDHFSKEGVGQTDYYIECGRLRLEVRENEEGISWHYYIGFVERWEDWIIDEEMVSLNGAEW